MCSHAFCINEGLPICQALSLEPDVMATVNAKWRVLIVKLHPSELLQEVIQVFPVLIARSKLLMLLAGDVLDFISINSLKRLESLLTS